MGASVPSSSATFTPTAVCGSRTRPVLPYQRSMAARVSPRSARPDTIRSVPGRAAAGPSRASPLDSKADMKARTASPAPAPAPASASASAPPSRHHRNRSKLLATWMSMEGLGVRRTSPRR